MNENKKYIAFKNRINEAEELFKEINFEELNEVEARYQITDENLVRQFNVLNKNKQPEELYYKLIEFMNPNNKDMVLNSKYGSVDRFLSKKRFDDIAVECLIMERLLEFGMFADLYAHEFKDLSLMSRLIVDCVQNGELSVLKYLFNYNECIRNKMIATFFNYSYCIPEITNKFKNDNIDYLNETKEQLEQEYYNLLNVNKKNRDEMDNFKNLSTAQRLDLISAKLDETDETLDSIRNKISKLSGSLFEIDTDSSKVKIK